MGFEVHFRFRVGVLRAVVDASGRSVGGSIANWQAIAAEVRRLRPRVLLVVSDMPREPMDPAEQPHVFQAVRGSGLENVRVGSVDARAPHSPRTESAGILAPGHGCEARVFPDEQAAERRLHYGAC